jgi:histone deacetylase complex regulatory component SIN3
MTEEEKKHRIRSVNRVQERVRKLEETHPHLKGFGEFLEELNKETERGAALASAAFVDDLVQQILSAFLLETESAANLLNGFNAPLGSFSARIAAAHAMGLISDAEQRECDLIRKVRNEFAHKIKMSFDDKRVQGLCSALTFSAKPYEGAPVSTRGAFTTAAVALILNLTNRPAYVRNEKLSAREWKY